MRSNLRWRQVFAPGGRNGEIVRGPSTSDAHDREVIAWRTVANAGVSGADICDIMPEAAEARFEA